MNRRYFILIALLAAPAFGHHGWSSFDQNKPMYLSGTLKQVRWQNPHAEAILQADATKLPAGLASRAVPAQQQSVDSAVVLKKTQLPVNAVGEWELEFAPLSRMKAWGLEQPPKAGDHIEVIGYTLTEAGKRVLRVEYAFINGKAYAFRSGPAT